MHLEYPVPVVAVPVQAGNNNSIDIAFLIDWESGALPNNAGWHYPFLWPGSGIAVKHSQPPKSKKASLEILGNRCRESIDAGNASQSSSLRCCELSE